MAEYIEREALRKVMQMATDDPTCPMHIAATVDQYITEAPATDVVPVRHGKWRYYHKQNIAVCTECSFERNLDANFGRAVSCPNCGAKMDS